MKLQNRLGIMQGRLSPIYNNLIQSFPTQHWEHEFRKISKLKIRYLEWTLDEKNIYLNPIFKDVKKIRKLMAKHKITIKSMTGDCFMQNPFWKSKKKNFYDDTFQKIVKACKNIGIKQLVIPLVDNGSIENRYQEKKLIDYLNNKKNFLKKNNVQIIFESDFAPKKLLKFIKNFDKRIFGINYDTGNSANLGYKIEDEFLKYGDYIKNIHIKDRAFKGPTVRLGLGDVDFVKLKNNLSRINYKGCLILQTARSQDNKHSFEIKKNIEFLKKIFND